MYIYNGHTCMYIQKCTKTYFSRVKKYNQETLELQAWHGYFCAWNSMLRYTYCFWHLHYFDQWVSIISSCLGATDIAFPSPTLLPRYTAFSQKKEKFELM